MRKYIFIMDFFGVWIESFYHNLNLDKPLLILITSLLFINLNFNDSLFKHRSDVVKVFLISPLMDFIGTLQMSCLSRDVFCFILL